MATLIVTRGKQIWNDRLRGVGTEPSFGAWGTGAGTTAAGDTTLFTESAEARVAATTSTVTTTTTGDTYQAVWTQSASAARAITNGGLLDASTGGNLFLKGDFATINLATGDSIQFTAKGQLT